MPLTSVMAMKSQILKGMCIMRFSTVWEYFRTMKPAERTRPYLRLLVHFVGDMHQPLHVGRSEDRGGNDIKVLWFGKNSNLHRVWDSEMINGYK
ncbi:MAG: hypothetical protein CM15mP83_0450 [Flavobacteriaceae bacterium]|nr:MAG: hypothetical protein CM15mP83_0450 [Flavobacteriaceae bacterium]